MMVCFEHFFASVFDVKWLLLCLSAPFIHLCYCTLLSGCEMRIYMAGIFCHGFSSRRVLPDGLIHHLTRSFINPDEFVITFFPPINQLVI